MSTIPQVTVAIPQKSGVKASQAQKLPTDPLALANTPDYVLEQIAKQEANQQFNNSPTRKITKVVGNSIPFIDSFVAGAAHKGSASSKLASSAGRGSDWGVFAGAIWLYNKALNKAYDTFPGMRKLKEDHPTTAMIGEVGSAYVVGDVAIRGYRKAFKKGLKTTPEQAFNNLFEKFPKTSNVLGNIFHPVKAITKMIPEGVKQWGKTAINKLPEGLRQRGKTVSNNLSTGVKQWGGLAVTLSIGGLILKNIFDVHKTKKNADQNLAELKDQRYQLALNIANEKSRV